MKKTVLVTGVGAIIGYGIIESLRSQSKYDVRIVGMDIYDDAYGQFICDKFYVAKLAYSEEYLSFVQEVITKEEIDIIIPGIEQDMYRLCQLKEQLGCKVVLNNPLLIDISKDKLATYDYFKDKDINVIPTLFQKDYDTYLKELGHPFLLKPRSSYASKGIHKIYNEEEFIWYNKDPDANIFQRIIGTDSEEYTVSVFGLGDGTFADFTVDTMLPEAVQMLEYAKSLKHKSLLLYGSIGCGVVLIVVVIILLVKRRKKNVNNL